MAKILKTNKAVLLYKKKTSQNAKDPCCYTYVRKYENHEPPEQVHIKFALWKMPGISIHEHSGFNESVQLSVPFCNQQFEEKSKS